MSQETEKQAPEMSFDDRAQHVLAVLDAEEQAAAGAAAPEAPEAPAADDGAPAAPVSWSKEEKALFARLPADVQAAVARREAERERFLSTRNQEIARRERELGDERERVAAELRLAFAQETDPILLEGRRTDWERLRRQDPAAFARKFPVYQERLARFERRRAMDQAAAAERPIDNERENARLVERAPELADTGQRRAALEAVDRFLQDEGFSRDQIGELVDHRVILLTRDAMRWREQERTRKAAAAKKVTQAPKMQRPGATEDGLSRAERLANLKKKAMQSGKLDDRAAYVLAALDEGE